MLVYVVVVYAEGEKEWYHSLSFICIRNNLRHSPSDLRTGVGIHLQEELIEQTGTESDIFAHLLLSLLR